MVVNDEDVQQLIAMGFPQPLATDALQITGGNLEMAINHLLSSDDDASGVGSSSSMIALPAEPPSIRGTSEMAAKAGGVLRGSTSQYNFPDGRSACTCIALTGAGFFLHDPNITPDLLDRMIAEGVRNYQRLSTLVNSSSSIEHLSAEEVLQKDIGIPRVFPLEMIGGIRQGILSHDMHHPLGMKALLEGIRYEMAQRGEDQKEQWTCILVTKTPETVFLCFPPDSVSPSSYWLVDSHPRPQLGLDTSYAKIHPSLDALLMSLQAIFPPTDLGSDIPEMMAMMYNSFDLYQLRLSNRWEESMPVPCYPPCLVSSWLSELYDTTERWHTWIFVAGIAQVYHCIRQRNCQVRCFQNRILKGLVLRHSLIWQLTYSPTDTVLEWTQWTLPYPRLCSDSLVPTSW